MKHSFHSFRDKPEILKWVILTVAHFANAKLELSFTEKIISRLLEHFDWILSKQSKPGIIFIHSFIATISCFEEDMLKACMESLSAIHSDDIEDTTRVIRLWGEIATIKDPAILAFFIRTVSRGPFYLLPRFDHFSSLIKLIDTYKAKHPTELLDTLFTALDKVPEALIQCIPSTCMDSTNIIMSIDENLYRHFTIPLEQRSNILQIACQFEDFYIDNTTRASLIENVYKNPGKYLLELMRSEKNCSWKYDSSMRSLAAFLKCKVRPRLPNEDEIIIHLVTLEQVYFLKYLPFTEEDNEKFYPLCITGTPAVPYNRPIIFYDNSAIKEINASTCRYIINVPHENASEAWNKFLKLLATPSFYDLVGYGNA